MAGTLKNLFWKYGKHVPGSAAALRLYYSVMYGDRRDVFRSKFLSNAWGSEESASGDGSTLFQTENLRRELPRILRDHGVSRFFDAPCGDYNWFRYVERENGFSYLGADIVPELIERNQQVYANATTSFMTLDIAADPLPPADLWMCRDCLFHLSNRDIFRVLANFLQADIQWLLTTTHYECRKNTDTATGGFRLLNLEIEPFTLGPPRDQIEDWAPGAYKRRLSLWDRDQLCSALAGNRHMSRLRKLKAPRRNDRIICK